MIYKILHFVQNDTDKLNVCHSEPIGEESFYVENIVFEVLFVKCVIYLYKLHKICSEFPIR